MPSSTYLIPGEIVTLSDKDTMRLEGYLGELLDDLERTYRNYLERDIPVWWKWYAAIPRVTRKDFPFRGASNVVIPYIRTISDAIIATDFGKIFGASPTIWNVTTENESEKERTFARAIGRHINWAANSNDFNFRGPVYDWLTERTIIGSSVLALNYRTDKRAIYFGSATNNRKNIQSQLVEWNRGPVFEHSPREHYLWDTRYRIGEAPGS